MTQANPSVTSRHIHLARQRERVGMEFLTDLLEPYGIDSSWVGKYMQMLYIHVVSYPRSGLESRLQPKGEMGELFCLLTDRPSGSRMDERAIETFWRAVLPADRLGRLALIPDGEILGLYKSITSNFAQTLTPQVLEQIRQDFETSAAIENPWDDLDPQQAAQDLAEARAQQDRTGVIHATLRLAGILPVDFFSYALFDRSSNKQEHAEQILRLLIGKKPGRQVYAAAIGAEKMPPPSPHGRWKSARRLSRQLTPQAVAICQKELSGGEAWMAPPKRSLLDMLPI
jgi:hypothetical protein